jgi:raffinose/stachyose/melibiose transport system substrate-binding protein
MRKRLVFGGLAALLALAACTPGSNADAPDERSAGEVTTDVAKLGEVTLTVWDQEVRGGQEKQITALNEEFQRRYPNITINRVSRSFDDLRDTVKNGLSGAKGPDVTQVNNGKQDMGAFVKAGLLQPLDGYAEAYGWTDRFPDSVRGLASYPESGDSLGDGRLYGLPQTGELVGIYYNKTKLTQLGIQPPSTWEEFDAALATAKAAGELPIQFGNLDKSSGPYLLALNMHRSGKPADEAALATGRKEANWLAGPWRDAAGTLVEWVDNGYLTTGFAGLSGDDAWANFTQGQGVFLVSGTWLVPDLSAAMGDQVGFLLPPATNGTVAVTGGTGLPWTISSKSEHPDAAAAYIDFITSPEAMKVLADNGNLPVLEAGEQQVTGLASEVFAAWQDASQSPGLVPYLDYATPDAYDVISGAVEQLLGKQTSVEDCLGTLQEDLDASRGGR